MLTLCAEFKALEMGREIHQVITEKGIHTKSQKDGLIILSSLVNMYAKCSSLKDAQTVS
jgi:hypothetical protein